MVTVRYRKFMEQLLSIILVLYNNIRARFETVSFPAQVYHLGT